MADPVGITFMPGQDAQALGPQNMGANGPGGDLSQAFKILSLRLPRVLGAGALSSPRLLNSPGASGSGMNPHAAVFEALLRALVGGGSPGGFPGGTAAGPEPTPYSPPYSTQPVPVPRGPDMGQPPAAPAPPQFRDPYQDYYQTPSVPFAPPGTPKINYQGDPPLPGGTAIGPDRPDRPERPGWGERPQRYV
jgi:hypothetical protein